MRIIEQERQGHILETLHQILTPFLLRRVKADVDLKIPPKKEVLVYCPMTDEQTEFYKGVVERTIQEMVGDKDEKEEELVLPKTKKRAATQNGLKFYDILNDDNDELSDKKFEKYLESVRALEQQKSMAAETMNDAYK